jgi:hypothetical protein
MAQLVCAPLALHRLSFALYLCCAQTSLLALSYEFSSIRVRLGPLPVLYGVPLHSILALPCGLPRACRAMPCFISSLRTSGFLLKRRTT